MMLITKKGFTLVLIFANIFIKVYNAKDFNFEFIFRRYINPSVKNINHNKLIKDHKLKLDKSYYEKILDARVGLLLLKEKLD